MDDETLIRRLAEGTVIFDGATLWALDADLTRAITEWDFCDATDCHLVPDSRWADVGDPKRPARSACLDHDDLRPEWFEGG